MRFAVSEWLACCYMTLIAQECTSAMHDLKGRTWGTGN